MAVRAPCTLSSPTDTVTDRVISTKGCEFRGVHLADRLPVQRRLEYLAHLNLGQPVEGLFDGGRIDVVTPADDELLLAAGKPEIAAGVLAAQITGVGPSVDGTPFLMSTLILTMAGKHGLN